MVERRFVGKRVCVSYDAAHGEGHVNCVGRLDGFSDGYISLKPYIPINVLTPRAEIINIATSLDKSAEREGWPAVLIPRERIIAITSLEELVK